MDKLKTAQIMREALATDVGFNSWTVSTPHLQIAFEMVAKMEREACARLCEKLGEEDDSFYAEFSRSTDCAEAIRKRSDDKTTND